MLPLWTMIDLTYIYTSGRGKSLTHFGFLQEVSEDSGLSVLFSHCIDPHPLNWTDCVREHMAKWDDELTQVCKNAGNIFNLDQFCYPILVYSLKTPFSPQINSQRTAKTHKCTLWAFFFFLNTSLPSFTQEWCADVAYSHLLRLLPTKPLRRAELGSITTCFLGLPFCWAGADKWWKGCCSLVKSPSEHATPGMPNTE